MKNRTADVPMADAHRRSRRLTWPLRIALVFVLGVVALFALRQVSSPDIGFHLKAGNYVLEGNGWPRTDPFTYTVTDHPYVDTTWGYQITIALIEGRFGAPGLVWFHVVLTFVMFSLVTLTARLVTREASMLVPLLLLGGIAAEPRFEVRPEMLSYTLLALVLYLLHRRAEGFGSPLWLLPAIFLVWANTHGLFVLGWAAMACFAAGLWWRDRRPDAPLLGWAAASLAVGLVNPYGWRALAFPFELATRMRRENVFARNIGEFFSPLEYLHSDQLMFYLWPVVCFFVFSALVALSLVVLWRQRRFWCVLLGVVFLGLALTMVRNIPPLVVACLPGAAFGLPWNRLFDRFPRGAASRRRRTGALLGVTLVVAAGVGARLRTDAYYISARRLERFGTGWNALALPIDAADYARSANLPGRMLNHLNFGSWLMWSLDEPVFIDGRLEVMGEEFFEEYRETLGSPAGLAAAVRRHDIGWIIFPYRLRPDLVRGLCGGRGWDLVYVDPIAAVFARHGGGAHVDDSARALAERPRDFDIATLPGLGGPERPGKIAHWLDGLVRRQEYPSAASSLGIFHFQCGRPTLATRELADAIGQSEGAYYELYNNLGAALAVTGHPKAAAACIRLYLRELPFYRRSARRQTRDRLAEIERKSGS